MNMHNVSNENVKRKYAEQLSKNNSRMTVNHKDQRSETSISGAIQQNQNIVAADSKRENNNFDLRETYG